MRYHGARLELDLRDNVQRELFFFGGYERPLVKLILNELAPTDTFVDVGAHIGVFTLPAAGRLTEGRVFAFEPAPDTAEALERNARRVAGCELTVVHAALGDSPGTGELRTSEDWHPEDLAVRSLHGKGAVAAIVPVVRFDDWAQDAHLEGLNVVKIDVEGNELEVLRGMRASLKSYRPRLVIVEIVPSHLARAGASPADVAEFFESIGYAADGPSVDQIACRQIGPFWPNALLRPVS